MSNSKISALTSATTPLAGTETLPIVQSGATVKTTVANVTGSGQYPGAFTTLSATGDSTLGDAITDTLLISGRVGIGSLSTSRVFQISSTSGTVTGTTQIGFFSGLTTDSTATSAYGVRSYIVADTATNITGFGYGILNPTTANSGSFNSFAAHHCPNLTGSYAGGVFAFQGAMTAGTGKYNFYASGNAQNLFNGDVLVYGAGGLGYTTGSGGTVTQATSRTTGVTLNKTNGAITLVSAAGLATFQSFTVTNSTVAATDVVHVTQKSGTDLYQIFVTATGAGSFRITFATTGGVTVEQPVFNFAVIKGVTA